MTLNVSAPWHTESFDEFLTESLPELLADRLPLVGYDVSSVSDHTRNVTVAVTTDGGVVETTFTGIPAPNEEGLFELEGQASVVLPTASCEELVKAEIRCVGEQLYEYVEQRIGESPQDLKWDAALLRSWLPLDAWVKDFLVATGQPLEDLNWLAQREHLRRLVIPGRRDAAAPGQLGRACPILTPEGPNVGKILSVALGAEIADGRLRVVDERPPNALSLTASMIPFLEHDDPCRALMGGNMMRQWLVPEEPEPALVQTGTEPNAKDFWCGRNLLTAFVSMGGDTFEDGLVVSASAAGGLAWPHALEPGDKLSNRHGQKGVVSRILPDEQMPRLPDGTPVEIVVSFIACHTRLNFGQIREAVVSRIARAEGEPVIVPPFAAPSDSVIQQRLRAAGLPESGMETLTISKTTLARPSTVGWVYWGKTLHLAADKLHGAVSPASGGNCQRTLEYEVLRDAGAVENILETFNTRSAYRHDADGLAARVAAGTVAPAGPPTPSFTELARRLAIAGIAANFDGESVSFGFSPPSAEQLVFAEPIRHPWLPDRPMSCVGTAEDRPEYADVLEANERLRRICEGGAPQSLREQAVEAMRTTVQRLLDELMGEVPAATGSSADFLTLGGRVLFSGRSVLAPGPEYDVHELGLPEELAWRLFEPLVAQRVGTVEAQARDDTATASLDEIMAESWVLLNRAPSVLPTSVLAFRPRRTQGHAIRIPLMACRLINGDFDGDQAAVFLPLTEAAQREAGETLTVAAHVRRNPEIIEWLVPFGEPVWGLAELSRNSSGLREIRELAEIEVETPDGVVTVDSLAKAARALAQREGVDAAIEMLRKLTRRGLEVAVMSGASLSPWPREGMQLPSPPAEEDEEAWPICAERAAELVASRTDYDDEALGPQLLAVKSGARGNIHQLMSLLGRRGLIRNAVGELRGVSRGLAEGLAPDEYYDCAVGVRRGLAEAAMRLSQMVRQGYGLPPRVGPTGFHVLARARRAEHAGIVFAHAAAIGETDPLADPDSRLFVGLRPL